MNKYALTKQQFDALRPHVSKRVEPHNIEAAYAVMVEDVPAQVVAERIDKSRQHVHSIVRVIWDLHISKTRIPADWVRVVVTVPANVAKLVKQMERDARKNLGTDKD